jgi:hypothetical protein
MKFHCIELGFHPIAFNFVYSHIIFQSFQFFFFFFFFFFGKIMFSFVLSNSGDIAVTYSE